MCPSDRAQFRCAMPEKPVGTNTVQSCTKFTFLGRIRGDLGMPGEVWPVGLWRSSLLFVLLALIGKKAPFNTLRKAVTAQYYYKNRFLLLLINFCLLFFSQKIYRRIGFGNFIR